MSSRYSRYFGLCLLPLIACTAAAGDPAENDAPQTGATTSGERVGHTAQAQESGPSVAVLSYNDTQVYFDVELEGDTPLTVSIFRGNILLDEFGPNDPDWWKNEFFDSHLLPGTLYNYSVCQNYADSPRCTGFSVRTSGAPPSSTGSKPDLHYPVVIANPNPHGGMAVEIHPYFTTGSCDHYNIRWGKVGENAMEAFDGVEKGQQGSYENFVLGSQPDFQSSPYYDYYVYAQCCVYTGGWGLSTCGADWSPLAISKGGPNTYLPPPHLHRGSGDYIAGPSGVFGINPKTEAISHYDGNGGWPEIGLPGSQFVVNQTTVYGMSADKSQTWQYAGTDKNWTQIAKQPFSGLIAGGKSLFATDLLDGSLWEYNGTPFNWSKIGLPGKQFVANDTGLYGLSADGSQIWQYVGKKWTQISNGKSAVLYAGGTSLFATNPDDGSIYQYNGTPMSWGRVGSVGMMFAVTEHNVLYGLAPDGRQIWQYDGTPGNWHQVGGIGGALYIKGDTLFSNDPYTGDLYQYMDTPLVWNKVASGAP